MNKEIKLFRILKSLSKGQLKQLQKAVESPLYAVSLPAQKLFKILVRKYPNFDSSNEGKEYIYAKVFETKRYNDLKLRRVFSDLTQVIRKFLSYSKLQNSNWQREQTLAEIYEDMGLLTISQDVRQTLHHTMEKDYVKNENYWRKKMLLYGAEQSSVLDNNSPAIKILEKTAYAADRYFLYATVRHALLIKSKAFIFNTPYELPYLDAVKKAYKDGLLREDKLFRLYILALQLIETPRKDVFFAYQSLFFSQGDIGYGKDGLFLFKVGFNYIARQNNSGDLEFKRLPLEWYKFGLRKELLFVNDLISQVDFSNIVYLACQNNEIDWAREFIDKYIKRLAIEIQEEEYLYSEACIFFQTQKFYQVIDNISEHSFSSVYVLKAKIILLKSQFEIYLIDNTYYQTLKSRILAFESYLYRDKSRTTDNKLPYINFCKVLKKFLQFKMKNTHSSKIKEWGGKELEKRNIVASKSWLLEKIYQS